MISLSLRVALAAGLAAWCPTLFAGPPLIERQWPSASIDVGFHSSASTCIYPAIGAANTWNAVGADFYLRTESIASHPRVAQQTAAFNNTHVTIEDADDVTEGAGAEARTTTDIGGSVILNSDVFLDRKRMNGTPGFSQMACTTAPIISPTEFDGQSAILHELGHVVGFAGNPHTDFPNCIMFGGLMLGQVKRSLCADEKEEYIRKYGVPFKIVSLPDVAGPQGVDIPARIFYSGEPTFPVTRKTENLQCPSGWSCSDYSGTHATETQPLTFNFKCTNATPMPTATFYWRTTLTDATGVVSNTWTHASTCTKPASDAPSRSTGSDAGSVNRIIITQ